MARLISSFSALLSSRARNLVRALRAVFCANACDVDRELLTLRTNLTRRSGWSAAGLQ